MGTDNPACFGQLYDRFDPVCSERCGMFFRCGSAYLKNIQNDLLNFDSELMKTPFVTAETTACAVAREVILETINKDSRPFKASEFHLLYYERCRISGVKAGNAERTVRKVLMNLRKEGKIKHAGMGKWMKP
jgi:hypothetical protein